MLSIVCPVADGSDVTGVGIFNAGIEEVRKIMDEDPGVIAGVLSTKLMPVEAFQEIVYQSNNVFLYLVE